ncbi:putative membrane protein [Synechococcus sp. BIOS-E4-1]|uniref:hypothetical protein n=1 Tax=Synechococcus sp. BIOS-E4-1 TaxID=1400864 RepID=UPI0016496A22|nr:hypothetical protein [Synechococcus sp. BIOS-E4-1]QNI52883.1 putative membrane protein [Synechococcus sp. BIOS-E4-1]
MISISHSKWPGRPTSLLPLTILFAIFFSFIFCSISNFLVPPPDAVSYSLVGATKNFAEFSAGSYHFGYYLFNILIVSLSDFVGLSASSLIVITNVACSYVSVYFLVRFLDLLLFRLNANIILSDFFVPNRTRSFLFLLSPLSPFIAWIPYNLKDCQVVALSSIMIYSICFVFESIFSGNVFSWKVFWTAFLFVFAFSYNFTLRSYFAFSVTVFSLLFFYLLTNKFSASPVIRFVFQKSQLFAFTGVMLASMVILILTSDLFYSRFIAFSNFSFVNIATIFLNLVKFLWGPLLWSVSPSYPLLYVSTVLNIVLWVGFGYLLILKSSDPFRIRLCALALLFMIVIALPYCIYDTQVGPRYRFFAEMILYVCCVYGFYGRTSKAIENDNTNSFLIFKH